MSWTQERITSALSHLDTPTADATFWERVHIDLLASEPDLQEATDLMSPSDEPMPKVRELFRSPRRARWYVAAAAAAAVLIAGLYAIGRAPDQTPGDSPSRTDIVLTDPLSLTLDDQPRTAAPPVSQSEYVVLEVAQLPPGWTASEETAFGIIPDNGYRVSYSVVSPANASYTVAVMVGAGLQSGGGTAVDINGHAGYQGANSVWWEEQPGVGVGVSRGQDAASATAAEELIDVARSVSFATVKELPIVPIDPQAEPLRDGAQFAGTLSGVWYTVAASTGPLRGMRVTVGDRGSSGVEEDRLSQPTDDPETEGSVNITGVTGYGVIAFGYTEPATAALRANLGNGSTIQVPVLRNPGETYFALPIPLGIDVTTLDFLDVAGATLRTATMPSLPAYFGHCCAGAPWTTELEQASTSTPSS